MSYDRLRIEPSKGRKGRVFEVALFNYAVCNNSWDVGASENSRPVYVSFAGSDQEARAFAANLRTGRRALVKAPHGNQEDKIECLRSAGYRWALQRVADDALVVTGYLPQLLDLDPGCAVSAVRFLFAPAAWWVKEQSAALIASADLSTICAYAGAGGAREAVLAGLFAAYLNRRSPLPIVNAPAFHLRVWRAAQEQPWFRRHSGVRSNPGPLYHYPKTLVGLEDLALVDVTHREIRQFLTILTRRYFEEERPAHFLYDARTEDAPLGETGIHGDRRLLPDTGAPHPQLGLFG